MTDLIAELEGVVREIELATPGKWPLGSDAAKKATNFLRTHHAEIAAAVRKAEKWDAVASIVEMADTESAGQVTTACGLVLIDRAATVNAGKLELKFDGVTGDDGAEFGDWIVTVKKAAMRAGEGEG